MIKCIFVGDEPNASAQSRTPFRHARCAPRLLQWIDYLVGDDDYIVINQCDYKDFELRNLFGKHMLPMIALGNKASSRLKMSHFKLPHPSGLNRQINDKAYMFKVLRACKAYLG